MPPPRPPPVSSGLQKGGLFNRYDFAYAGRDTVNQAFKNLDKSAPALIQNLSGELNNILEQRIHQLIPEQIKQLGPPLLKGAIEDTYKTPFKLLGKFGKSKLAEARQRLNKELNKLKKHVGV